MSELSPIKKTSFYCIILGTLLIMMYVLFECILPSIIHVPHLTYRRWGDRPTTFYPNQNQVAKRSEYSVRFKTNSLGFNDKEHEIVKPSGRFRILLLGDSYIESKQVQPHQQFSRLLEEFGRLSGLDIEVIAMGMSGYGQAQHLEWYEYMGKLYQPDLVITFFCTNDLWNNEFSNAYFQQDGKFFMKPLAFNKERLFTKIIRRSLNKFESYYIIKYSLAKVFTLFLPKKDIEKAHIAATGTITPSSKSTDPNERLSHVIGTDSERRLFINLLQLTHNNIIKRDQRKWLNVIVSSDVRKYSDNFKFYHEWVTNEYKKIGIETINLHSEFHKRSSIEKELPHFDLDSHWNSTGHQWVSERLFAYILEKF